MWKEYNYAELEGVIKVGDIVRAVTGKLNPCTELDSNKEQRVTEVSNGYFRINHCAHRYKYEHFLQRWEEIKWVPNGVKSPGGGGSAVGGSEIIYRPEIHGRLIHFDGTIEEYAKLQENKPRTIEDAQVGDKVWMTSEYNSDVFVILGVNGDAIHLFHDNEYQDFWSTVSRKTLVKAYKLVTDKTTITKEEAEEKFGITITND